MGDDKDLPKGSGVGNGDLFMRRHPARFFGHAITTYLKPQPHECEFEWCDFYSPSYVKEQRRG